MKLIPSLLLCSALVAAPCPPAQASTPVSSTTQEDTAAKFLKSFAEARKLGDAEQMAQVVKRYQNDAVAHIVDICTQISNGNSEELETQIQALIPAWRSAMKGEFAARYYEYLSLISPPERRERERLVYEYQSAVRRYFENLEPKVGPTFEVLADEFESYASAFASIGDQYMTAQSWMNYSYCFEDSVRSARDHSPKKVIIGFTKAIAAMDRIDLKYARYYEVQERAETLGGADFAEAADDPSATLPGEPVIAADPVSVTMEFEALQKMTQFQRPSYFVDGLYQMWPSLVFNDSKTAEATIPGMEGGPRVLRREQASLEIHSNSDDEADAVFKITGKQAVIETEIQEGGKRGWAFVGATGLPNDIYQGQTLNLAPAEFMSLFYINAASVVGELAGVPLRVIDDNEDGIYGTYHRTWGYVGLSKGHDHVTLDSIVIGKKSKRALPWSHYQKVGETWYTMLAEAGGTQIVATPMEVQTGTLKLVFKGPQPTWLIVQGTDLLAWSYFDLLQNGKGKSVEVPVGAYELRVGEVRKGKKTQTLKALILPGEETPIWRVKAGEETVVTLGAPFGFDFKHSTKGSTVTVEGHSVTITGVAGERYDRTWNCVPDPTMSVRKVGDKRGSKPEQMEQVLDMQVIKDGKTLYGYADVWHPLDYSVDSRGDAFEVQLVEKKNKLFGKIESEWL